jgi:hypothetical protein
MGKLGYFILLSSLLLDGGVAPPSDAGSGTVDAGVAAPQPPSRRPDAGQGGTQPVMTNGIQWPEELHPLATLDGPAVLAAHAALQQLLARLAKEYQGNCSHSAKAMDVTVSKEGELYFVRIDQRMDRCGWAVPPGFSALTDWYELYAVSPEGKVLARYPYTP